MVTNVNEYMHRNYAGKQLTLGRKNTNRQTSRSETLCDLCVRLVEEFLYNCGTSTFNLEKLSLRSMMSTSIGVIFSTNGPQGEEKNEPSTFQMKHSL